MDTTTAFVGSLLLVLCAGWVVLALQTRRWDKMIRESHARRTANRYRTEAPHD